MKSPRLISTLLLLAFCASTEAQSSKPFPSPPYLRIIPPNTKWIMDGGDEESAKKAKETSSEASANSPMGGEVLRRQSVKSERVRNDIFLIAPDIRSERWMASGYLLIGDGGPENIIVLSDGNPDSPTGWLDAMDFRELRWVSEKTLKGWAIYEGREVLLFEGQVPVEAGGLAAIFRSTGAGADGGLLALQDVRAWIDPETKLPIAYFDGIRTYRYSFEFGVSVPPLPDAYRTRIEAYIRRSRSLY